MPNFTQAVTGLFKPRFNPKKFAGAQHAADRYYYAMAKEGRQAELVTSDSALGQVFEELKAEPFVKRFLRRKPRLILVKDGDRAEDDRILSAMALSDKTILVSEWALHAKGPEWLRNALARELAHVMAGNVNFRSPQRIISGGQTKEAELLADKIATFITGDPEGMRAQLNDIYTIILKNLKLARQQDDAVARGQYPSLGARFNAIEEVGEYLRTGDGKADIEDQLTRQLNDCHEAIFNRAR